MVHLRNIKTERIIESECPVCKYDNTFRIQEVQMYLGSDPIQNYCCQQCNEIIELEE